MTSTPSKDGAALQQRSDRFHLWRSRKDTLARRLIALGGVSVIFAVVLIFFYLLWVVFPMFLPAGVDVGERLSPARWSGSEAVLISVEEQQEVGLRLDRDAQLEFFNVQSGDALQTFELGPAAPGQRGIEWAATATEQNGLVAYLDEQGGVGLFRHRYDTRFSGGVESREIVPLLEFPYGEDPLTSWLGSSLIGLALTDTDTGLAIAMAGVDGAVQVLLAGKTENFMTGEISLDTSVHQGRVDFRPTGVQLSSDHRWLYLGDEQGRIHQLSLPSLELVTVVETGAAPITVMQMLLGGNSLLAGTEDGRLYQLFPVRDEDNRFELHLVREFAAGDAAWIDIVPEARRKGFIALDAAGTLAFYHSTANRRVQELSLADLEPGALALSPRANGLLVAAGDGSMARFEVHNEHPEISFSSIWQKVWYENYSEPEYVWQSSAATNEFEPKFSLAPLVFGTLKAAVYAMLFAIPLALMGAAYTAYFMAPGLRQWVKPGIEIMEALPTVILGFLAGLWFAPFLEERLAGIFMLLLVVPVGLLLMAWMWHRFGGAVRENFPDGWEPLLQVPMMIFLCWLALQLAEPVQALFFDGDLRSWMTRELGISYDQRNAMVVGFAMGFAVVPTIFSIAEDAIFGVPKSLSSGSLALGATPWQTLVKIVLPTASPGIFSGLMIGLGRAVGETMIVLMATGNTPVMDWNLFEGMRTLAANIAVEMPESEVNSSHYRVLFLAALVLFLFTFVVNTGAEIVRQRLREKYSSL